MKYLILLAALVIGIGIGITLTYPSETPTGQTTNCFAENHPCECTATECICGNLTLPANYCLQSQPF